MFLTSTWLFTQPNSLTNPETIWVKVLHDPTLLLCLGVTWLPNFSGDVLAGNHSPSGGTPSLCISHCVFITPSYFKHPGLSWCGAAFPAVVGEGAADLQLWIQLSSKSPAAAADPGARCQARDYSSLGSRTGPKDLIIPTQSPYYLFFNILYNFGS